MDVISENYRLFEYLSRYEHRYRIFIYLYWNQNISQIGEV